MRVLVACEFSGVVRDAFIARGHDAWSCDLLPSETEGPHLQCDVLSKLSGNWDMMIAHPPCTHLAVSGARWFPEKRKEQAIALQFVIDLLNAPIPRIALENPVGIISTHIRKPNQIVQPFFFGDSFRKTTCLWLKNLPKLVTTNFVDDGEVVTFKSGRRQPKWYFDTLKLKKEERAKARSRTFPGIAAAMADQWGSLSVDD